MSNLTDIIVTTACAAMAGAASIVLLNMGAGVGVAGLTGLGVFCVGSQLQNVGVRRRDRSRSEHEMRALKRADLINADQLAQLDERICERLGRIEAGIGEREGKLSSEIKLFETLLRQFAESMVKRVQLIEAAHAETAGHTRRLQARLQGQPAQASATPLAGPEADAQLLDTIQRSLIENRIDLHLQPVVSLPQRKLRFYEALTRLRTPDGALILPGQYLRVAEEAGLMSTVDNLLLFRCVQFIRRLTARHKDVGVFCNISAHSLADAAFFPQFVDFMRAHRDLGDQIVFELPQSSWDRMGQGEAGSVTALAELGFAFSMDHVTHLAFDFDALRKRNVRFIKASPALLLDPDLQIGGGIRAEDLGLYLSRHGIALVGEKIETERQVVDLLDFAIAYGQGYLFGEPKPLREDAPEPARPEPVAAAPVAPPAPPQPVGMAALFQARERRRAVG
ncbi:MAG: EAL domain-containing protein [Alphaproteobacteria bacterium]|nr:EAL domain-containing protein [Alphaproteobacteria bacterium]